MNLFSQLFLYFYFLKYADICTRECRCPQNPEEVVRNKKGQQEGVNKIKQSPNESFLCVNSLLRWPAYHCLQVVSI